MYGFAANGEVDMHGQIVNFHKDHFGGILGRRQRIGHDHRNCLTHVAYTTPRKQRALRCGSH